MLVDFFQPGGVLRWVSVLVDVIELVSTLLCGKEESSGC
jgi:hypothetical protein